MKTRILILDANSFVRAGLVGLVNGQPDLEVCGEDSALETALPLIRRQRPALVIVDLALHDGRGTGLIRRIIATDPSLKVLVCSIHDETFYAERALAAGAKGYVSKQEPSRSVLEAIRRVLSGGIYPGEEGGARRGGRATRGEPPDPE